MSLIPRLFASIQSFVPTLIHRAGGSNMHTACTSVVPAMQAGGAWGAITTRSVIRIHFPRAKEGKRVKTHGWAKRMSTPEGRRVIMRRILKGRHVLTH